MPETAVESIEEITPQTKVTTRVDSKASYWRKQLRDACLIATLFLTAVLVLVGVYSFSKAERDFVYFYSVGTLLNERPSEQLYDYQVQLQIDNRVHRITDGFYGPSPYPPFVALFFRPWAALPFMVSYHLWMVVTLCLYISGLALLVQTFLPDDRLYKTACVIGGLLFWPFLGNTLLNGQLSSVAFFAFSCALWAVRRNREYLCGVFLAVCLYKPTLVAWILLLLLFARAWKTLAAFLTTAFAIVSVTTMALGTHIWKEYAEMTTKLSTWQQYLHQEDHVDILGVIALATGGTASRGFGVACCCVGAIAIVWMWRYVLRRSGSGGLTAALAFTLPPALLVNPYSPIYDSVLLIVSLLASAQFLRLLRPALLVSGCIAVLVLSYLTTFVAARYHIQLFAFLIAAISAAQLIAFRMSAVLEK